tara:strand:+ start:227 stop:436 length:210 start_codon:yes stop_codon:yes gene_type:complete
MSGGEDTPNQRDACLIFWLVKGHLNTSLDTVYSSYNGYFKRVWYDEETWYKYDGFEEAYKKMLDKQANL